MLVAVTTANFCRDFTWKHSSTPVICSVHSHFLLNAGDTVDVVNLDRTKPSLHQIKLLSAKPDDRVQLSAVSPNFFFF